MNNIILFENERKKTLEKRIKIKSPNLKRLNHKNQKLSFQQNRQLNLNFAMTRLL